MGYPSWACQIINTWFGTKHKKKESKKQDCEYLWSDIGVSVCFSFKSVQVCNVLSHNNKILGSSCRSNGNIGGVKWTVKKMHLYHNTDINNILNT